jgi:multidrug resistance efflux pump
MMRPSRPFPFWLVGIILLAATVAGAGWVLHSRAGDNGPTGHGEAAPPVSPDGVVCHGHVDIENGVTPLYPLQPGEVVDIPAKEDPDHATVKKGDVLLRLDDRAARYVVRLAQQDLKAAQLQLTDARKLPARHVIELDQQAQAIEAKAQQLEAARQLRDYKQKLLQSKIGADEEVRAADAQVKQAEAAKRAEEQKLKELKLIDPQISIDRAEVDVAAKQIRLEQAEHALDMYTLKAPVAGKVLRVLVSVGETLSTQPKQPAIQFCANLPRIVRAEVEQEWAGRVAVGQAAVIQDDASAGKLWHGKVVRMSDWFTQRRSILMEPLQLNDVRTLECIVQLDDDPNPPRIGQRVRVSLGPRPAAR